MSTASTDMYFHADSSSARIRAILTQSTLFRLHRLFRLLLEHPYSYGLAMLCAQPVGATARSVELNGMPKLADVESYITESIANVTGVFYLSDYTARGMLIRSGRTNEECIGNLSWVLENLNPISAAEYNGAAGGLSLLPTAWALIGAPAKELWVVYKLMPIAGILTMRLSLGGTIMPSQAGDYDPKTAYDFDGLLVSESVGKEVDVKLDEKDNDKGKAEIFAEKVKERAEDQRGASYGKIWVAVVILLGFNIEILVILWYAERGAVIPWWCSVSDDKYNILWPSSLTATFHSSGVGCSYGTSSSQHPA